MKKVLKPIKKLNMEIREIEGFLYQEIGSLEVRKERTKLSKSFNKWNKLDIDIKRIFVY